MVEHLLAKEKVAGSNPVFRSRWTGIARLFSVPPIHLFGNMVSLQHGRGAWRYPQRGDDADQIVERGRGGMADATVLNTVGETRAGSNPAARIRQHERHVTGIAVLSWSTRSVVV